MPRWQPFIQLGGDGNSGATSLRIPILFISMAASFALSSPLADPKTKTHHLFKPKPSNPRLNTYFRLKPRPVVVTNSLSISNDPVAAGSFQISTSVDDLVASILSKVAETDRGVSLSKEGHKEVAAIAQQLQRFCVPEPVNCPLIFGEWDVVYCSRPTSPGGGYRSALGRLVLKTKEMIQKVEAPDTVKNNVSFSLLGFLDGEVSLKGKLKVLDEKWIEVRFEAPELKVGGVEFRYGGESEVKLQISYIDEKIRLGIGSRGSLFVFKRR